MAKEKAVNKMDKICIDVFQKYFERLTEKIQPNHLGLNYTKKELQEACDILEMENVLIRYPDLGYGDFNEYQVNSDFINAEREKVENEQVKEAENYMHSLPRDFFSLFTSAFSEGFIENITANNFDENKRTYNIRFNKWLKKKYNLSDDTLKVEGASINGVNGNTVAFKNPNTEYKCEYYTLNIFKEFLEEYYKEQKEIAQFFDKRKERNKIEVGLLTNPNTIDRIENTWVMENSKGIIINPTHDFEKLKQTRLELYEKRKTEFIDERKTRELPITDFELNSFYIIWLEKELKVTEQWLSDTYPNGIKKKNKPTASTQIETKKYKTFVENELKITKQPKGKVKTNNSYSHKQIAIAYAIIGTVITKENAKSILEKHSSLKSIDKLIQKRITKTAELTKLFENKTTDSKHLKDLQAAERLISGTKNKNAKADIRLIITAFTKSFNNKY